ncbi:MAG: hypothetical protein KJ600_06665 [Nanoarchaeota archaeon]|nr:hypothetical protein [Nanoarchaeota archaeon]MBU1104206.1 hypothetical protein [Nanoarchaeota archaeon]
MFNQSSIHYVSFEESFLSEYLENATLVLTDISSASVTRKNQTWMDFDGVSNSVNVSHDASLNFVDSFTISTWLNGTYAAADYNMYARKGTATFYAAVYYLCAYGRFYTADAEWIQTRGSTKLDDSLWHHLVYTYDSGAENSRAGLNDYTILKPFNQTIAASTIVPGGAADEWDDSIREIGNMLVYDDTDEVYLDINRSYVDLGDVADFSFGNGTADFNFTFSLWLNYSNDSSYQAVFGKYTNPYEYYVKIDPSTNILFVILRDNSAAQNIERIGSVRIPEERWVHLAVTYNASGSGNGIRIYFDGVDVSGTVTDGGGYIAMENTASPFTLGRRSGGSYPYNGSIDEFRIYNKTLSLSEILEINASGRTRNESLVNDSSLVAWYDLDEGTGKSEIFDHNGVHNGTLQTAAFWSTDNKRFKLFYTGFNGTYVGTNTYIGCAYSGDGVTWTKYGKIIEDRALEDPYVVKHNGYYFLYAEDKEDVPFRNIRGYNATDFTNWTDMGDVLDIGTGWESQDISSPAVLIEDGVLYMMYEGRDSDSTNPFRGGQIGLANSTDGVVWSKNANNPVMSGTGNQSNWDANSTVPDDIISNGSGYFMLYHGVSDTYGFWAGMVNSTNLINWSRHGTSPISFRDTAMFVYNNSDYLFTYESGNNIILAYPWRIDSPKLYVDGSEELFYLTYEDSRGRSIATDSGMFSIGKASTGTPYAYNGSLDEMRLYNVSLSASEILEIYNNGRKQNTSVLTTGNNSNQVLYMPLNENQGATTYEQSGQSNNGTVSGATWKDDGLNVSFLQDTDYTLYGVLGKIELLVENYDRSFLTANYNSTTEILNNTKSTDSTFKIYNLTGALVYNKNGSIYGEQNLSKNTGNLNVTLPPGNLTYVLNNFNLSEGANRSNSPLAVLSKTTVTAADGTSTVTYLLNSTLLDTINQTDFFAVATCLASGDTAVFTHSGVQTTPNDRCVSTGNVLFTLDNFGNGTNTLTINYNTATYSESIVTTPRGGSTLMDINIGSVQGGDSRSGNLKYGSRLKFEINGTLHQIRIKTTSLSERKVVFEVSSTKQEIILFEGESKEVDLDFDGVFDVRLTLEEIISGSESRIVVTLLGEVVEEEIKIVEEEVGEVDDEIIEEGMSLTDKIISSVLGVVLVGIVLLILKREKLLIFRKRKHLRRAKGFKRHRKR